MRAIAAAVLLLLMTAGASAQVSNSASRKSTQVHRQGPSQTTGKTSAVIESGQSTADAGEPHAKAEEPVANSGPTATDAERTAVTFSSYDLDIRLTPQTESLSVRAVLKIRNTGQQPLLHLPVQISSSLTWHSVRVAGSEAVFGRQTVASDADHTGALHEAVVVLVVPLAVGKDVTLDVAYGGRISPDAHRLETIGTPRTMALHSDWDRISPRFVGLRGFGNVAWYPIASVPVLLGDGAKLFTEIGKQKQRQSTAKISMRVSEDYFGVPPNVAILNGQSVSIMAPPPGQAPDADVPQVVTCALAESTLGFATPSLFLAERYQHDGDGLRLYARAANEGNVQAYLTAATMVQPLLHDWLGTRPRTPLTVLDLPEAEDTPYETGAALFLPLKEADAQALTGALSHALAHAYFASPRQWMNEGVAHFMADLWMEKSQGRTAAIQALDSVRGALAIAEPASPGSEQGQALADASDAIYYRTKASYVLWMLRDLVGDTTLSAALRAYNPADDLVPEYFERLLEQTSRKPDLQWFFNDWVYRDQGLPDLTIAGVYPSKSSVVGSYLVAVEIANDGYAEAVVPVTVRSKNTQLTERVHIPSRSHYTHRMVIQGAPIEVIVNDGSVPEVVASSHSHLIETVSP